MAEIADQRSGGPAHDRPQVTTEKSSFGGSYGLLMLLLPPLVYYLWICMRYYGGELVLPSTPQDFVRLVGYLPGPTLAALGIYAGWFGLQVLLQLLVPGPNREGLPLSDGRRLTYRMNGWASFLVTIGLFVSLVGLGGVRATFLYDHMGPLLTVANLFSFALSLYLYRKGRAGAGGGRPLYNYFMGTELNPRDGRLDWKFFCEARPGMSLWVLLNVSLAARQIELFGHLSTAMGLVCLFQVLYVADYYFHEEAILTTWDVRHEKFGWMLCWGCLVFVPFTYSLQAQYLVEHAHELPVLGTAIIVLLNFAGYYLFRSANLQKHRFRTDPTRPIWGRPPQHLRTSRGTLLLTSGFWGVARHLNYTGDLMMGLAWCLPCLFANLLPYFYFIYFAILLFHRERRDHDSCRARYGPDWDAYCARVRWRMLPGIY